MGQCCTSAPGAVAQHRLEVVRTDAAVAEYVRSMDAQLRKALENPQKIIDTAASKRSPFKFERRSSQGKADVNLGVSAVALPDEGTEFGRHFLAAIEQIQDLCTEALPSSCTRQTVAHMSIGSVILDKATAREYNDEMARRSGFIARVKAKLDEMSATPPRARVQTLKINKDGCVTVQLEHDPKQDVRMPGAELREALGRIPTCQDEEALAKELKRFGAPGADGSYCVSRFQQVRLALGGLGCEIKGLWPSGHMVVVNIIDPVALAETPQEKLDGLWSSCYAAWSPLVGQWFELKRIVCLCYVERSLNHGSVVAAPTPGEQPKAFPETNVAAQSLLGGIFTANEHGDVLLDEERFLARCHDQARGEWRAFQGEVLEQADIHLLLADFAGRKPEEVIRDAFKVFDKDASGWISTAELGEVMRSLGENLSEAQISEMARVADADGSGQIDYKEFAKLMRDR